MALLLALPVYVVVQSHPLYDLGRPGRGGGEVAHATEFHLLPILAVAYLVAQSGSISPLVAGVVCLAGTGVLFGDLDGQDCPLHGADHVFLAREMVGCA